MSKSISSAQVINQTDYQIGLVQGRENYTTMLKSLVKNRNKDAVSIIVRDMLDTWGEVDGTSTFFQSDLENGMEASKYELCREFGDKEGEALYNAIIDYLK